MERILAEQNPWWEDAKAITADKHILEYESAKVRFPLPQLKGERGVCVIRGPRQVGKTTLVKTMIRERLKGQPPEGIFYFSAESGYPLEQALREYLDFAGNMKKAIFIDEITQDKNWATKVKYLIDAGKIGKDDLLVATGSSSADLKAGAERLPGRFIEGNEHLFYPYSFRDCTGVQAPRCGILDFDSASAKRLYLSEGLRKSFFQYIRNGGLPAVWNTERELAKERYARWIEGMMSRHGRSLLYSRELLAKLGEKSTFDFLGLARETSIRSHHTVEEYLLFFEAGMLGRLLYNYNLAISSPDPKKEKKFVFIDPFIAGIFPPKPEEPALVEGIVGSHLLRICDELYFCRDKRGEIDYLCKAGGKLVPVEVKWQNKVDKKDAALLQKFGRGFLVTKDTLAVFGNVLAVPAFVFLALTGVTLARRKVL